MKLQRGGKISVTAGVVSAIVLVTAYFWPVEESVVPRHSTPPMQDYETRAFPDNDWGVCFDPVSVCYTRI